MSINLLSFKRFLMIFSLLASVALLGGCFLEGDDGSTGPAGAAGADGQDVDPATVDNLQGQIDDLNAALDAASQVEPESCSACHGDVGEEEHQAVYDDYDNVSNLSLTITDVTSVDDGAGGYNVTMTISIEQNGLPFIDADGLPSLQQKRFYIQGFDPACTGGICYPEALNKALSNPVSLGGGDYQVTAANVGFAIESMDGQAYAYIAQGVLDTEGMTLYGNVSNAALAFGAGDTYVSAANVEGCQKCHGTPYMKHGYRAAAVNGIGTFSACKVCHLDDRNGSHRDWQQMVDDPVGWANGESSNQPQYDYKRTVMNDVHMSHAMEFPYPMSMANCATCHEGKMAVVTDDDLFVAATCKSCHPVQSTPTDYIQPNRAPALEDIWAAEGVGFHDIDDDCQLCHTVASGYTGDAFSEIHTGYNKEIYADDVGTKYSDLYQATIDSVTLSDNVLDIKFTTNNSSIVPSVYVSFYGYDTKQFIIPSHDRDGNNLRTEKTFGVANALFTEVASTSPFEVTLDLAAYASDPSIPDMIASGVIKKLEVSVLPTLKDADGLTVALDAPSATLDIASNTIDPDYFKGANAVVDVEGCNACHDALATTFHSANRGGNITVCKNCHAPKYAGSHLEMQSRSIESYVHAIHSFQAFDFGDVDFTDPVEAARYELHIEHTFPNFTIKNCEACHKAGTYNVPDQSQSLPGVLSASDSNDTIDRNIGDVPSYVAGPASRACGGCHRAEFINEDEAGELAAWNQHTKTFGYLIETADGVLDTVTETIMSMFQ